MNLFQLNLMAGMLLLLSLLTNFFYTFGVRFRLHEKMSGGLTASPSGTDGRVLDLVKELERRVEALDGTTQAEVCRIYSFGLKTNFITIVIRICCSKLY